MAKVIDNIFVRGLSGSLGDQFIVKTFKNGRTVICKKPIFKSDRTFSQAQVDHQQAFREAAAYAKQMKGEEIYVRLANRMAKTPYNLALSDWFNPREILAIDLSGWTNGSGDIIRINARDNIKVQGVKVTITDENGVLLEEGQAQEVGALWWEYRTAQTAAINMSVTVSARDLPGHITERAEIVGFPKML
jgi:hypothetical protein